MYREVKMTEKLWLDRNHRWTIIPDFYHDVEYM
jgi:hypothetical protein